MKRLVTFLLLWISAQAFAHVGRSPLASSVAGTFTYGYYIGNDISPAPIVRTIGLPNLAWITNHFDSLDRLDYTALMNRWGHVLDGYSYTHDPLGLRTNIVRDFGLTTNSVAVGYDNIGQLIAWSAKELNNALRQNEQFGWGYDSANNLQSRANRSLLQTFNSDAVNELTNIFRTGTLTLSGATPAPATNISVNGSVADRYGDFTFARTNLSLNDGSNAFTNIARNVYGLSVTNTLTVTLPANVNLQYDSNGNLTNDGTRSFVYDAENQLTNVYVSGQWKTEFVYDGIGRRRIARDYAWTGNWVKTNETRYICDGMLPVQERDANNIAQVTYTRGLDLSGSIEGAGGTGGLLARTDVNGSAYYHADGAGNITALMGANGDLLARYLYNPFGKVVGQWGALANANMMQFSSISRHANSGLSLYTFRGYDPSLQRWINQDPIGEAGGINLYGFVGNSPLNIVDLFGLDLWMSRDGQVHTGTPPSEQPVSDPISFGALHGMGDITDGQLLGDYFRDDFVKPVAKKSGEIGLDVAMTVGGLGEGEAVVGEGKGLWNSVKRLWSKCKNWKKPPKPPKIPKIMGHTPKLRNPAQIDKIKADMLAGKYRFDSPEGIIAGVEDENGVIHLTEGQHRMNAALEIYEETGDPSYVNQLIDSAKKGIDGRSYIVPGTPPANSMRLPRR